jgi:glutathionylspermidine synthase
MKRRIVSPRENWINTVEEQGLVYHHHSDGSVYWDETAYYQFGAAEIDRLEQSVNDLYGMCLQAVDHIIRRRRYAGFDLTMAAIAQIEQSRNNQSPTVYGRFDLAYDGNNPPKLLEFNADTPTALLEAGVIQWFWLKDLFPNSDQFNSIHERLVDKWKHVAPTLSEPLYFACVEDEAGEDLMTTTYLQETAEEAGVKTSSILMSEIGWDGGRGRFVDLDDKPMKSIFKLYPWEWMLQEPFGQHALETYPAVQWIEPIWKMLLSNKQILSVLWELYPGHPNLLETYGDGPRGMSEYVTKPTCGREGVGVAIHTGGGAAAAGQGSNVYQKLACIPSYDGKYPVLGAWVVGGQAAGIGVRESITPITDNRSCFVPHLID